jgi:ureidoglycolate lyase
MSTLAEAQKAWGTALRAGRSEFFAPFGTIVEMARPATPVNGGTALRHDVDVFLASEAKAGFGLVTSIYDADAQKLPFPISMLERHSNSTQLIVPIKGEGHTVIVCLSGPDGAPDLGTLSAFRLTARQGVIYHKGLWHYPILALESRSQFLVQSWQNGTEGDCEIVSIAPTTIAANEG